MLGYSSTEVSSLLERSAKSTTWHYIDCKELPRRVGVMLDKASRDDIAKVVRIDSLLDENIWLKNSIAQWKNNSFQTAPNITEDVVDSEYCLACSFSKRTDYL